MRYSFGFALTTALGNMTRYIHFRKYAERDPEVDCFWSPISHYLDPDPYKRYPGPIHTQLILQHQAAAVLEQWDSLDAVMIHAFQLFSRCTLKRRFGKRPLLVLSQDYAPMADAAMLRAYGQNAEDNWKRHLRYKMEVAFTRRADLYLPWSQWAAKLLTEGCGVPTEKVQPIQLGIDLEVWNYCPKPLPDSSERTQILFVGGDFVRKGGDLLLDVFTRNFSDRAELHLVTRQAPKEVPPHVHIYGDLKPNDGRLRELYAECDLFVLPTRADMSSLVTIEAMATGSAVIATDVGGISDRVQHGVTGCVIPPKDGFALTNSIEGLLQNPRLAHLMGEAGRQRVEREFSAEINSARIMTAMKTAVQQTSKDRHPGARPPRKAEASRE